MPIPLVLASASPARLATLRAAGIAPTVIVSDVDEDAVLAQALADDAGMTPASMVELLARAKAEAVLQAAAGVLVLGCDSMLEFEGEVVGKPGTAQAAVERWRRMRGGSGTLHTGHWLVDSRAGGAQDAGVGATSSTVVRFADLDDAEIDAYVATGEPLHMAGAFTIDGLGGAFVTGIEGDHHGVVGVSLPLLRTLLGRLGLRVTDLWNLP